MVPAAQAGGVDGDAQVGLGDLQGRLDPFAFGDVDHHAAMANRLALIVVVDPAADLHPFHGAVGLDQPVVLKEAGGGFQGPAARGQHAGEVVGMHRRQGLGDRHAPGGAFRR